ncbi:MAG: DUF3560 domain-containing protein [Pusillimonas sp.]
MNHYKAKQAARKARYEERAAAARDQADAIHAKASSMTDAIPFGQPVLVGHHSESRDRNYRARIHRTLGKAFEALDKAEHYEQKAATVGKGGISSDDPDAIEKLKAQLSHAQAMQDLMKKADALLRKHKNDTAAALAALTSLDGITEAQACALLQPEFAGRSGFASYQLTNNNANMRRIAARIKELERAASRDGLEKQGDGYLYRVDPGENRAMFLFDGKPLKETRDVLKRHGFRWSPTRDAWVRQLTGNAQWAAKQVMTYLEDVTR